MRHPSRSRRSLCTTRTECRPSIPLVRSLVNRSATGSSPSTTPSRPGARGDSARFCQIREGNSGAKDIHRDAARGRRRYRRRGRGGGDPEREAVRGRNRGRLPDDPASVGGRHRARDEQSGEAVQDGRDPGRTRRACKSGRNENRLHEPRAHGPNALRAGRRRSPEPRRLRLEAEARPTGERALRRARLRLGLQREHVRWAGGRGR